MRFLRIRLVMLLLATVISSPRTMAQSPVSNEHRGSASEIRDLYDRWAAAFKARDLDGIMSVYAPGDALVAYDIVAPLQYVGEKAYRRDNEAFLAQYQGPIEIEYRDLHIIVGADVGFIHALERISGTLKSGRNPTCGSELRAACER